MIEKKSSGHLQLWFLWKRTELLQSKQQSLRAGERDLTWNFPSKRWGWTAFTWKGAGNYSVLLGFCSREDWFPQELHGEHVPGCASAPRLWGCFLLQVSTGFWKGRCFFPLRIIPEKLALLIVFLAEIFSDLVAVHNLYIRVVCK